MPVKSPYIENLSVTLNHYLSLLTIIGGVCVVIFAGYFLYLFLTEKKCVYLSFVVSYIFPIGFFVTLGGVVLSLFYSYVLGYVPCDLCWYQRIFLYPQVFLFALAWIKKDKAVIPYTLILSSFGFLIALYHHALQIGYDLLKPCSTAPFAVDCAKPSFVEFGFVTFPFMSVVLFGFLIILTLSTFRFKNK